MTRSAARRHGAVQADKSLPPAPPAFDHDRDDPYAAPASSATPWYWRFVMFLWLTSFVFLLAYEWLAGILKSWGS
jgi:hypothetical protein